VRATARMVLERGHDGNHRSPSRQAAISLLFDPWCDARGRLHWTHCLRCRRLRWLAR